MMNKNTALIQEWQIFKAICPKSILRKIKGKDTDTAEYYSIANAVFFLGFSEICDEMLENAPQKFAKEKEGWNKNSTPNIEKIDYICSLFIKEIKSQNLQKLFKASKSYHINEYELYQKSRKTFHS